MKEDEVVQGENQNKNALTNVRLGWERCSEAAEFAELLFGSHGWPHAPPLKFKLNFIQRVLDSWPC